MHATRQRVAELLQKTADSVERHRRLPEATYRLQFHAGFTFRDALAIVPYLQDLGITHLYASPYLRARPGSTHGYDISDHGSLNPEIGSEEDYEALSAALKERGLGQILDTVPNHMGVVGNENAWWNDVLENGPASMYADFFDIAWDASPRMELRGRLLLPILGDPYGKVLESGELKLAYDAGALVIQYHEHRLPIDPGTYDRVLGERALELEDRLGTDDPDLLEYLSILTSIKNLPPRWEWLPELRAERQREKDVVKRRLGALSERSAAVRDFIAECIAAFSGSPGDAHSFDPLDALLDQQAYRLSFWRVATDEINYRRFFDVNELAALSMEREEVFVAAHQLVLRLLGEHKLDGLRIDHPDGLFDPRGYLRRLQQHYVLHRARKVFETDEAFRDVPWEEIEADLRTLVQARVGIELADPLGQPLYVLVEKILGAQESVPADWPTHGTSGYDFLNMVNGLFLDDQQVETITRTYREFSGVIESFAEIVYQKKFLILQAALASELYMLSHQLDRLAQKGRWTRDFTLTTLRHALREVIACFPVYRSYIADGEITDADRTYVRSAVRRAKGRNPSLSPSVFNFVQDMLLLHYPESAMPADRAEQLRFVGKFEQVTAPVMAKGVEDTAFYNYNRLVSLNEVGGDPSRFGVTAAELHRYNTERHAKWPWALSATSTHDTKRGEDVRARLNVLSELADEWRDGLARFSAANQRHRPQVDDESVPDANMEHLLYQILLGAWPLEPYSAEEFAEFCRRVQSYMVKALHEAKVHSSWINPNQAYDEAMQQFVAAILDEEHNGAFIEDFLQLQRRASHHGLLNSLSQTLLKIASPGVPDLYQGTEIWDFSLVDPDNRRPVDYERRRRLLDELKQATEAAGSDRRKLARKLLGDKEDGRVKLYLTTMALRCRGAQRALFATGEYLPAETNGNKAQHLFGFVRRDGGRLALVAVPRLTVRLVPEERGLPLGANVWEDTLLLLPDGTGSTSFTNVFTGAKLAPKSHEGVPALKAAELLADFPVALLLGEPRSK